MTLEEYRDQLQAKLDACFCDDRDGNSNPPHAPECDKCRVRRKMYSLVSALIAARLRPN